MSFTTLFSSTMARAVITVAFLLATIGVASAWNSSLGVCTLGSAIAAGGCATGVAAGLSAQIAAQLRTNGYGFPIISSQPSIHLSPDCQPFLQQVALNGLLKATAQQGDYITLNAAFRSAAQQYMLYSWYQRGMCGIQIAAIPGTSNHEGGSAIDVPSYTYWRTALEANGFRWYGSGDLVHYDYVGSGIVDLRAQNLKAFQQLWNKNNPGATISEDGVYGPMTAKALDQAPCNGW